MRAFHLALFAALTWLTPDVARAQDDPPPPPLAAPPAPVPTDEDVPGATRPLPPPAAAPAYPQYPPGAPAYPPNPAYPTYPSYAYPGYPTWPAQPPRPTRWEMRPRWGLFAAGMSVFGGIYLMNVVFGGIIANEPSFYVPIFGPVIYAGVVNARPSCSFDPFNPVPQTGPCETDSNKRLVTGLTVFDTLGQAAGATMAILGLVLKQRVPVYGPVTVLPALSSQMAGLVAAGRF